MFSSLSLSFHLPRCCGACVCVCTICTDVKLHIYAGACGTHVRPHATKLWAWVGRETRPVSYTCIYIYISRTWAHISRSWGGHISNRCCFIRSMSTVIFLLYIFLYYYIRFHSSCQFCWCFCMYGTFHLINSTCCSEQVCVCVCTSLFLTLFLGW